MQGKSLLPSGIAFSLFAAGIEPEEGHVVGGG